MGIKNENYLCGGTFFTLLWEATRPQRPKELGKKTDFTGPDVMRGLISLVNPSFEIGNGDSFEKAVSNYRACKVAESKSIPITDAITIDEFDARIKGAYAEPLSKMESIVADYITGSGREEWLVKQLISLIEGNANIPDGWAFYIFSNGQTVARQGLDAINSFEFAAFLLGVWHYVVVCKPDNKAGEKTFDSWHNVAETSNTKREFNGGIKSVVTRNIKIDILCDEKGVSETLSGADEQVVEETPPNESGQPESDAFEWDEPFTRGKFAEPPPNATTQTLYNAGVIITCTAVGRKSRTTTRRLSLITGDDYYAEPTSNCRLDAYPGNH